MDKVLWMIERVESSSQFHTEDISLNENWVEQLKFIATKTVF